MHVVATAGHVDHGKSTLVRALTGMEPDRWAAERRRGLTIDLGFAWCDLPSGETVAFVDVPGHQRFIANMLAGVGPVPAAMFVVAADEGWRRQSGEHLAALHALDVRHGLLAVTRSDLADPGAASRDARDRLAATSLGPVEAVAVSGATGAGLPELRAALDRLIARLPSPASDGRVRLWVDRCFSVRGAGVVVTGTLPAGTVRVGDELIAAPTGRRLRVRGLQTLQRAVPAATAVSRVAVNLRGTDAAELRRGDALVTPGAWLATSQVDARLSADSSELPRGLVLHVGSASVPVQLRPLGPDTARLTLATALPLQPGDRALLRDPAEQRVAAGVVALDVAPPVLRRRGAAGRRGAALADMTGTVDAAAELARRGTMTVSELAALGAEPADTALRLGDRLVDPGRWQSWQGELAAAVDDHATRHPLDAGLPLESARRQLRLPDMRVLDALARATGGLVMTHGRLARPRYVDRLPGPVQAAIEKVVDRLGADPFAAPEQPELNALGLGGRQLAAAERAGLVLRLPGGVILRPDAPAEAVARLRRIDSPFTVSAARQALGTTRRVAVPLLELLDARGLTRRVDSQARALVTPT